MWIPAKAWPHAAISRSVNQSVWLGSTMESTVSKRVRGAGFLLCICTVLIYSIYVSMYVMIYVCTWFIHST